MENRIWYNAHEAPFTLHGLAMEEGYARLPKELRSKLPLKLQRLSLNTSGGRVRFRTDAKTVSVRICLSDTCLKTHMTPLNMAGAELYQGTGTARRRVAVFRPEAEGDVPFQPLDGYSIKKEWESTAELSGALEDCTLYLPSFIGVERVEIGLPEGAGLCPASPYAISRPIVFYGSSITHGACAGRPSLTYPARVCAALDADYLNLGFAGHALGEMEIAEYIASLHMSAFVLDYDHNAPSIEHLAATHGPFLETVLKAQPQTPVLVITMPYSPHVPPERMNARFEVIRQSYQKASAQGYRVALLNGNEFFPKDHPEDCLMDFVHPNDQGFACMAERVLPLLRMLLSLA